MAAAARSPLAFHRTGHEHETYRSARRRRPGARGHLGGLCRPAAGADDPGRARDRASRSTPLPPIRQFCAQYASRKPPQAAAAANNQAVGTAIIGTALGAGLGAAIGGGRGAAIGAASGAGLGTVAGASGSAYAQMSLQQQYDVIYGECMMAHGNQVPGFAPPPGAPPYGRSGLWPAARLRPAAGLLPAAGLRGRIDRFSCWPVARLVVSARRPFGCRSERSGRGRGAAPASDAQTIASSSESKWRTIGAIFAVPPDLLPFFDQACAHAGGRGIEDQGQLHWARLSRRSFRSPTTADPGYTLAGRLIY